MTDPPALTRNTQGARRDFGLMNRAYRLAKRRGDYGEAMKLAQAGDESGIPVGRPAAMEEIEGVGGVRTAEDYARIGQQVPQGGLASFDFSHSRDGGPGVGGYNFNQTRQSPLARPQPMQSGLAEGGSAPQPGGGFYGLPDRRAAFSRAWNTAKTQEEKDALVVRASELGVPMNDSAEPALQRMNRGLLPQPNLSTVSTPSSMAVGPQRPAPEPEGTTTTASPPNRLAARRRRLSLL
jgi:hypothetical protein